jgi:hypothetical protein
MESTQQLAAEIDGELWIASHGGVASERLRNYIQNQDGKRGVNVNKHQKRTSGKKRRPVAGVIAHYPFPIQFGPKTAPSLCIYLYGSVYESILSQLKRHPDNSKKLHNDEAYPEFSTLQQLLAHPDLDPFGIQSQFDEFLTANVRYPILLVRYDVFSSAVALKKLQTLVEKLLGRNYSFTSLLSKGYKRKSTLESISNSTLREQFLDRYSHLQEIFDSQPVIRLLMPATKKLG